MKLRLLLSAAAVLSLLFTAGCQHNITYDLQTVTLQKINQDVHIGMSRDEVIQKYGNSIFLQARTAAADEELLVYLFLDTNEDGAVVHNLLPLLTNDYYGVTRKALMLLFDQQHKVKNFKFAGFFAVEAYGFVEYRAYMHPLNERQLNMPRELTLEEGKASYLRYLEEVEGRDPSTFNKYDLAGNRDTRVDHAKIIKDDAEAFAGPLKDILVNDKPYPDPQSQAK